MKKYNLKKGYRVPGRGHDTNVRAGIVVFIGLLLCASACTSQQDLVSYVNPLTGTAASTTRSAQNTHSEQNGNTIPAVGVPFAMTQWTPQTRPTEKKCQAPYYFKDRYFSGIRGTHWLSGSCTQDYGSFTIMPIAGNLQTRVENYRCSFDHHKETATPYFYRVELPRYHLSAEVTATSRCGMMRFTYHEKDSAYVLVVPNSDRNDAFIKIDKTHHEIVGYNPAYRIYQGWGLPAGFSGYFVIRFQHPFRNSGTFSGDSIFSADSLSNREQEGAYAGFDLSKDSVLLLKVGTSFSSIEEARKNLDAEIPGWDFHTVKENTKDIWEKSLEKIRVKGTETDKRIFYTAMYHTMQQPRIFNDADGTYPVFAQQYKLAALKDGNYYDDFSMWDIYRADIPLCEILAPSMVNDWVRSMILKGQQGGWLPIFPCWNNYTAEMIGDHVTAFIASAYLKGIKDYDIEEAYRLMYQNAFDQPPEKDYLDGKGRRALSSYIKYGFIPLEDSVPHAFHKKEQVSRTLEYAYDDYCLALVAKHLKKNNDYQILMKRALNYKNVFDNNVGLMNGRYTNGNWYSPFYADKRIKFVTESTPRQYSFYVPQDIPGLARLMGGRAAFELSLDSLFMKGNYNHGNEPDQQAPFLYNHTPHAWKSQLQVRKILQNEYADGPGGLSGNDDAGAISAWYIFASLGFYPVDPASGKYLIVSPLFDRIRIKINKNNTFSIVTHKQSLHSMYIDKIKWNGRPYLKNYLLYDNIMQGGKLEIFLGDHPSDWGSNQNDQPKGL
jgi:predicted alpha-1,2-mannosidase